MSSKSAPKCSQNRPRGVRRSDKIQSCDGPGPKMLPNGSEDSKSDHFGVQNDLPRLQNRPPNDLWGPKSGPKTIFYHRLPTTFNNYRNLPHNFNFTFYTSHIPRPTLKLRTSHFAHYTSHLIHFTQHSPAVCAKRLNNGPQGL